MSDHDEQLARMRAEMDQAREAFADLAAMLRRFNRECVEAGFTEEESFTLSRDALRSMLRRGGDGA